MLLSVILPVFNGVSYLERCVHQIIDNINFDDYELIIVNDGSSDGTDEIARSLSTKDKHIKYLSHKNHGVSYSRNRGIANATGKWIQFVDVDDTIHKQYYKKIYEFLLSDSQMIIVDYKFRSVKKPSFNIGGYYGKMSSRLLRKHLFRGRYSGFIWDKVYSREYILKNNVLFKEDLKFHEDCFFNYNYLYGNPKVHYLNECLYTHIINSDSVMFKFNTSKTFNFEYLKVIDAFDRMLQMESQITRNYKSYVLYSYYNYIQHILSKMAVCDNVSHDEYERIRILSQNIKNKIPFTLQILLILKQIKTFGR